jgi:hypothetical protein
MFPIDRMASLLHKNQVMEQVHTATSFLSGDFSVRSLSLVHAPFPLLAALVYDGDAHAGALIGDTYRYTYASFTDASFSVPSWDLILRLHSQLWRI